MCDERLDSGRSSSEGEIGNSGFIALHSDPCYSNERLPYRIELIVESSFQSYGIGFVTQTDDHSFHIMLQRRFQFL